jgi:ribosome-binding protein aMBF1 (putative translation factor)
VTTRRPEQATYREITRVLANLPLLLREARRARDLSIRGAAKQIGIGFGTVARIEAGDEVNLTNALAVLTWLDLSEPTEPKA